MNGILNVALGIHFTVNMDSAVATTREFWRRKALLPEEIVKDPRNLGDIVSDRRSKALEES